ALMKEGEEAKRAGRLHPPGHYGTPEEQANVEALFGRGLPREELDPAQAELFERPGGISTRKEIYQFGEAPTSTEIEDIVKHYSDRKNPLEGYLEEDEYGHERLVIENTCTGGKLYIK